MSVKDMTDQQLNMQLEILLGAKEDRHRKGNVIKGTYSVSPKDYCADPAASLEVQANAIEVDAASYVQNLQEIKWGHMFTETLLVRIAELINASPRERAEAAYMTLSSRV
ncbi:hypothetical protein G9G54_13685 [Paenibacillus sp. EKM212P]|uniref:hypothetical protein n=1 Tax=Paenibacillus sp. EKM212P TaxID=1683680 RepID=UPI0013EE140F|nr:hypothetical protein [Paenibacillus sp. EKM212P]KAF6578323.1 hypothetical protein G9G54_13685 [Paenibacillus sp. EKM212P]